MLFYVFVCAFMSNEQGEYSRAALQRSGLQRAAI